jgi:hypothetical protein
MRARTVKRSLSLRLLQTAKDLVDALNQRLRVALTNVNTDERRLLVFFSSAE